MPVLDAIQHKRLLEDKDHICAVAGLQPRFLAESMTEHCGPTEVDWVRRFNEFREKGTPGLLLKGLPKPDTRCQAICAALIRNFINARVIPVNTLLDMHDKGGDTIGPTVILIPNLYITANGKAIPAFKIQNLYDVLLVRSVHSKPTVVYVENTTGLITAYGQPFADFLDGFVTAL